MSEEGDALRPRAVAAALVGRAVSVLVKQAEDAVVVLTALALVRGGQGQRRGEEGG